jgi:hypothetical protein
MDSTAAEAMNKNDKSSHLTRHIARRWFIHRDHCHAGHIKIFNGDAHNIADVGTKNGAKGDDYKLSIIEHAVTDTSIAPLSTAFV